ncbi:MAG: hypothetical protein ALECFALPRED_008838 [Alectoria fallacina]|uniref:Uncharacterized protein n=1 Tax=Alectoria fallacina TaxID=1903189 RepID=A0A8H3IH66_9LECA|nr:MAG: hypothetical protein ALECFALPRED_008838 [Alectoria fallacina]
MDFAAQFDLAAVQFDLIIVTVLLRREIKQDQAPPLITDLINANQTKYDIDPNLTEKAREKARRNAAKNVAKRLKKQQIQSDKKIDEDDDDEKGNGMKGM